MPTRMRESPFSLAACEKLENDRSFGDGSLHLRPAGSVRLQAVNAMRSSPKMEPSFPSG